MSELPDGWQWLRLEQLAAPEPNAITDGPFGSNLKTADYVADGEVRVIRLGNLGVGSFVDDNKSFVTQKKFSGLTKHEARGGDLVVAALAEPVGRCVEVPPDLGTAMVKADCVRVRVHPAFHHRYVMHALNSPDGLKRAEAAAHGIGRLRINLSDLRSLLVPVAPPREQRRIVAKLEALQSRSRRAREALDAVPPLLEKLRQSLLAAAFRGDLTADWRAQNPNPEPATALLTRIRTERRKKWEAAELAKLKAKGKASTDDKWKAKYVEPEPVDANGLPEQPDSWCWATIDELAERVTKGSSPNWQGFDYVAQGIAFVRSQNIGWGTLDLTDVAHLHESFNEKEPRSVLREGDVLLNIVGASIGRAAVATSEIAGGNTNQAVASIRLVEEGMGPLVVRWLLSPLAQRRIHLQKVDVARANLSLEDVAQIPMPLPPAAEAMEIQRRLRSAMARVDLLAATLEAVASNLGQADRATLAKAFRGELVPQDPNDEPTEVTLSRAATTSAEAPRQRGRRAKAAE